MNWIKNYLSEILLILIIVLIGGLYFVEYYVNFYQNEKNVSIITSDNNKLEISSENKTIQEERQFVDVKGAVKTPGVYEITVDSIVNDAILLAGGFNSNAYTKNINLSKKLKNETVIYVYTKYEYSLLTEPVEKEECVCPEIDISQCINNGNSIIENNESTNQTEIKTEPEVSKDNHINTDNLININSATKEQLMNLNGIGESKAQSIIDYRLVNGNFNTIEDIKLVSGISDSIYAKIKDFITI